MQSLLSLHLKRVYKSRLVKKKKKKNSFVSQSGKATLRSPLLQQQWVAHCSLLAELPLASPLRSSNTATHTTRSEPQVLENTSRLGPAQHDIMQMSLHTWSKAQSQRQQLIIHGPRRKGSENATRTRVHLVCPYRHF